MTTGWTPGYLNIEQYVRPPGVTDDESELMAHRFYRVREEYMQALADYPEMAQDYRARHGQHPSYTTEPFVFTGVALNYQLYQSDAETWMACGMAMDLDWELQDYRDARDGNLAWLEQAITYAA